MEQNNALKFRANTTESQRLHTQLSVPLPPLETATAQLLSTVGPLPRYPKLAEVACGFI